MENSPKIRFPEFRDRWSKNKLGMLLQVTTGNKDTKDKESGGSYPFFVRSDNVERINSYSYDGEAILTSGDGVGVGKNFHYINGRFDYHQRVYCLYEFSDEVEGKFIYHFFSKAFYRRVMRLSAKNSVDSVRMDMITEMPIRLPSLEEQQKIADFLSSVDQKIQQLRQKKELLDEYKKGAMQKLFSQEIRFKDENGEDFPDWKKQRIGNQIVELKKKSTKNNQFEVLTSSNEGLLLQKDYYGDNRLTNRDNIGFNIIPPGYITFRNRSDVREFTFNENKFDFTGIVSSYYPVFKMKNGHNKFFTELTNLEKNFIGRHSVGTSQTVLSTSNLKSIKFDFPCDAEQQKISNFASSIDKKIKLTQEKIKLAQTYKKGLLQQMFV